MKSQKYLIVDDDQINNIVCNMTIKTTLEAPEIMVFESGESCLDFLQTNAVEEGTVLLLDINMPTMTGWEFMEQVEAFDAGIMRNLHIYMLSSSLDDRDKKKAYSNNSIKGFISKPLTKEIILDIEKRKTEPV